MRAGQELEGHRVPPQLRLHDAHREFEPRAVGDRYFARLVAREAGDTQPDAGDRRVDAGGLCETRRESELERQDHPVESSLRAYDMALTPAMPLPGIDADVCQDLPGAIEGRKQRDLQACEAVPCRDLVVPGQHGDGRRSQHEASFVLDRRLRQPQGVDSRVELASHEALHRPHDAVGGRRAAGHDGRGRQPRGGGCQPPQVSPDPGPEVRCPGQRRFSLPARVGLLVVEWVSAQHRSPVSGAGDRSGASWRAGGGRVSPCLPRVPWRRHQRRGGAMAVGENERIARERMEVLVRADRALRS